MNKPREFLTENKFSEVKDQEKGNSEVLVEKSSLSLENKEENLISIEKNSVISLESQENSTISEKNTEFFFTYFRLIYYKVKKEKERGIINF